MAHLPRRIVFFIIGMGMGQIKSYGMALHFQQIPILMLFQILFSLFIFLPISAQNVNPNPNPCFYGWTETFSTGNELNGKNDECENANDCGPADVWCMFSPMVQKRICCRNRQGAILPECPSPKSPMNGIILCSNSNINGKKGEEEENCPQGYVCMESRTQFQKSFPGQPNTICCPNSK